MLHTGLATNPYALAAIVCAATFMVAPITLTVYRYAAFLTLITFHSLILCQYKCDPISVRALFGAPEQVGRCPDAKAVSCKYLGDMGSYTL